MPKVKKNFYAIAGVAEFYTIVSAASESQAVAKAMRRRLIQGCAPDPRLSWRAADSRLAVTQCMEMMPAVVKGAATRSRTEKPTRTRVGAAKPKQEEPPTCHPTASAPSPASAKPSCVS